MARFEDDDELLLKMSLGDEYAKNILVEKYRHYSWYVASKLKELYPIESFALEDYMAVAFGALSNALKSYNFSECSFYGYWYHIVINDIRRVVRRYLLDEYWLKKDSLSFDIDVGTDLSLHDVISDNVLFTEQNMLRDTFLTIVDDPKRNFTDEQRIVIHYFLDGYELKEIREIFGWSKNKVYYLYNKAIKRIRIIMNEPK